MMLIINNMQMSEADSKGQWFERELWGAKIRLKIRPHTDNVIKGIRAKCKSIKDKEKREEAVLDAMYDYILEDFEGFGEKLPDGTIKEMETTLENKKKILFMPVPIGEQPNWNWVINKANELGFEIQEEEQGN